MQGSAAKWFALGALLTLALAGCSKPTQATADFVDYGTYHAIITTKGDWSKGIPISVESISSLVHGDTTTSIPARPDVYWGFRASVTNKGDQPVEVVTIIKHPPITTPDGKTSTEEKTEPSTINPKQTLRGMNLWFFVDSCPFEFVPGDWTLQLSVDGQVLLTKTFEVYKP